MLPIVAHPVDLCSSLMIQLFHPLVVLQVLIFRISSLQHYWVCRSANLDQRLSLPQRHEQPSNTPQKSLQRSLELIRPPEEPEMLSIGSTSRQRLLESWVSD